VPKKVQKNRQESLTPTSRKKSTLASPQDFGSRKRKASSDIGPVSPKRVREGKSLSDEYPASELGIAETRQVSLKKLEVLSLPEKTVIETVAAWLAPVASRGKSKNQYGPSRIVTMKDSDLRFPKPRDQVPCKVFSVSVKDPVTGKSVEMPKLMEPGANNDHPRVTISGRKFYVYHLAIAYDAYTTIEPRISIEDLGLVSSDKKEM
jgi:hypothetical protein